MTKEKYLNRKTVQQLTLLVHFCCQKVHICFCLVLARFLYILFSLTAGWTNFRGFRIVMLVWSFVRIKKNMLDHSSGSYTEVILFTRCPCCATIVFTTSPHHTSELLMPYHHPLPYLSELLTLYHLTPPYLL